MKDILTLGIETSCDETAAAVVKNGQIVLSSVVSSQIDIHRLFGGVVPEVASRNHAEVIDKVVNLALKEAHVAINQIDCIGVTYGAGLEGALLVGVSFAKSLAQAAEIPLFAVNHIEGHAAANFLCKKPPQYPFISLTVSGGHTAIFLVKGVSEYLTLCSTVDDAIGEAFDKVARLLGLPYPGGPEVDRLSKKGKANIVFPSVLLNNGNFSYSGIKTAVANYLNNAANRGRGSEINKADVAASFTFYAVEGLIKALKDNCKKQNLFSVAVSGGVASNSYLRQRVKELEKEGYKIFLPQKEYCCDNGAMIASRAYFQFISKEMPATLDLNAQPSLKLRGEYKKKDKR